MFSGNNPMEVLLRWFHMQEGSGAGCVIVSPNGMCYELSISLEFACTNNQAEYEGLLHRLDFLREMGGKEVEASGDSSIVVQQIKGESQCWDGVLNSYRDKCLDLIKTLETFHINYKPREKTKGPMHWLNKHPVMKLKEGCL
jgi:ribonuclease HI